MGLVTLTRLIERTRSRADMAVVGFVSAQECLDWINEGCQAVHQKLVSAYGEKYRCTTTAIAAASGLLALPANFFKLYSIDMTVGGRTKPLLPYEWQERNLYRNPLVSGFSFTPPRYSLVDSSIKLLPAPADGTSFDVSYAPEFTLLVNGADTVNFMNGWEKYAIVYAAREMLKKEESSISDCDRDLAKWDFELEELAKNRDAAAPKKAVDMDAVEADDLWGP